MLGTSVIPNGKITGFGVKLMGPPTSMDPAEDNYVKVSRQHDSSGARIGNPKIKVGRWVQVGGFGQVYARDFLQRPCTLVG